MSGGNPELSGRLELTWTNKHRKLLAREDGSYQWLDPADYRIAEVRLLHEHGAVGHCRQKADRAKDNLLIRGDALHGLRSLSKIPEWADEYVGQVRLAYLDPTFNTGQAFEQYDDALEHSVWLTMIRDRLEQIRRLLAPNGSVWLHLDDHEVHRARCVLDEIFGPSCYAGTVVWRSRYNSSNDAKRFSLDHNYLVVYAASEEWTSNALTPRPGQVTHDDPRGPWFDGNPIGSPSPRPNLRYDLIAPDGTSIPPPPNGWRWSREVMAQKIESGEVRFAPDNRGIRRRTYLADHPGLPPSTLWTILDETGHNRQATYESQRVASQPFDTPKPERLLKKVMDVATDPGDIVLDPFVGSGTTAAVAHKMNRRWVAMEWQAETVATHALPRLEKVVAGTDRGGVTEVVEWAGGGGFRVLDVAPSMYEAAGGSVFLADWATNGALAEACAAQLSFTHEPDGLFVGRKGRFRLAVIDGLVDANTVQLIVGELPEHEKVVIAATAIEPTAAERLRELSKGSRLRKIPDVLLRSYVRDTYLNEITGRQPTRVAEDLAPQGAAGE